MRVTEWERERGKEIATVDAHEAQSRSRVMVVTGRSQSQAKLGHL